jgi:capsular polysaccharide export protein
LISNGLNEFSGRRVLMLQGPVGPFFSRLAADLTLAGAFVFKVNFNGGDWLFSRSTAFQRVFDFTGHPEDWPAYFLDLLLRLNIDTVFLFGDCRSMHVAAMRVIREQGGIRVGVFEEGYLRPDFITLERDGVNNNSSLPDDPRFYLSQPEQTLPASRSLGSTYGQAAKWGMMYFAAASVGRLRFIRYRHHRRLGISDGPSWVRSFWRKQIYGWTERHVLPELVGSHSGNFFLVSLQTRGDAQMSVHSDFDSVEQFIEHVMASFADHAPTDAWLVLKHHPLDRGYSDYTGLIAGLVRRHGLEGRCHYIHDQHLPTLLQHTRGVVVVNSTAGLSAVGEGVPVKVCGKAIYDIQGLTFQGALDDFWKHAHLAKPSARLYQAFRNYLICHTQHQGSFYKQLPGVSYHSGVMWADHGSSAPHHLHGPQRRAADMSAHAARAPDA